VKKPILALAACLALAGPAYAQSIGEKTGINSALGVSLSTPDFIKQVAIGDMFEIDKHSEAWPSIEEIFWRGPACARGGSREISPKPGQNAMLKLKH